MQNAAKVTSEIASNKTEQHLHEGGALAKSNFEVLVVIVDRRKTISSVNPVNHVCRQVLSVCRQASLLCCTAVERQTSRWSSRT